MDIMDAKEFVTLVTKRMEEKLDDILQKNLPKVEDPEKLKEAIAKAKGVVEEGKRVCMEKESLEEATECLKRILEKAKTYLGKDYSGSRTAKAAFSRCINTYMKRLLAREKT